MWAQSSILKTIPVVPKKNILLTKGLKSGDNTEEVTHA